MTTATEQLARAAQSDKTTKGLQGLNDIDEDAVKLTLAKAVGVDIIELLTGADIERTIEGASTLTYNVTDSSRELLRSGLLSQDVIVDLDGLKFELAKVRKTGDNLDLIFEDRRVHLLRGYNSKLGPVSRATITRAQFILRMIKEVKLENIPVYIPQLLQIQPIEVLKNAKSVGPALENQGIPTDPIHLRRSRTVIPAPGNTGDPTVLHKSGVVVPPAVLTIKGSPATPVQTENANVILRVGKSMGARRKVLVVSIMTAIQESSLTNLSGGDRDSKGVFQQRPSQGWPASGDVAKDARAFFEHAIGVDRTYPNLPYYELAQRVQISAYPTAYAPWRTEAEHFVTAFGEPGGDTSDVAAGTTDTNQLAGGSDFFFYRGIPPQNGSSIWKKEDSWTCIQRLAAEVQWRAFFLGGKFYYLTEDFLFKSQPAMTITEDTPGVDDIDFDFDENKRYAEVTITAQMKRWAAPPGTVVMLRGMGPVDGRWMVTDARRSLFNTAGTITLKKPQPKLPEPASANLQSQNISQTVQPVPDGQQFRTPSDLVNPIPKPYATSHGPVHNTVGLPGYPAIDFFAEPGTPVVAPESGTIERFSGHDPALGPISPNGLPGGTSAAGGPLGWTIYMKGDVSGTDYFITHLGSRQVAVGAHVSGGQVIGTVANYDRWGRKSHTHIGVSGGSVSIEMLGDALRAS